MDKIFTVIGSTGNKANKLEQKLIDFIFSGAFLNTVKIGDSLSEKKMRIQFTAWNKEKLTVNVNSIINAKNLLKVAKLLAKDIHDGLVDVDCIPVVHINRAHGNCSIDFVASADYDAYYTEKETKPKAKKDVFEYLTDYLSKEDNQIAIESTDGKNEKIDAIIAILASLKD